MWQHTTAASFHNETKRTIVTICLEMKWLFVMLSLSYSPTKLFFFYAILCLLLWFYVSFESAFEVKLCILGHFGSVWWFCVCLWSFCTCFVFFQTDVKSFFSCMFLGLFHVFKLWQVRKNISRHKFPEKCSTDVNTDQSFALLVQLWLKNAEREHFLRVCVAQCHLKSFRKNNTSNFPFRHKSNKLLHVFMLFAICQKSLACTLSFNTFISSLFHHIVNVKWGHGASVWVNFNYTPGRLRRFLLSVTVWCGSFLNRLCDIAKIVKEALFLNRMKCMSVLVFF